MKANEVMVGDYVYNHRNWECPIAEIHKNSAVVTARHYGEEEFLLSDLKPIPLTPEILEKNGFVYKKESGLSDLFVCVINNGDYDKTSIVVDIFQEPIYGVNVLTNIETASHEGHAVNSIHNCDIEYVHQLQHALRLCGTEKEIIL